MENETPYLADCARLDWARLVALRAPEAAPCPMARLAQLDPENLAGLRIILHPSLATVTSDWPILAIASAHETLVQDFRGETALALRPDAELAVHSCPPGVAAFLRACADGKNLGEAACAAGEAQEIFNFGQTLVELVRLGAIIDFV